MPPSPSHRGSGPVAADSPQRVGGDLSERPTPAPAIWPYPHRTLAQVMRDEVSTIHPPQMA